ncbi:MAG: site-specific recombinase, invertase Pin [Mucilaginibacter sp.]|nr:site-specific recombinase, invertase Pin [Mucilaginibacter sp.]
MVIKDIFNQQTGSVSYRRKELLKQIQVENDRLSKARKLLLDDAIDSADYKVIKGECESKPLSLEAKLTGYSKAAYNLNLCIDKAILNLSRLNAIYMPHHKLGVKRNVISSIYPEKLCFDGTAYPTIKLRGPYSLILL